MPNSFIYLQFKLSNVIATHSAVWDFSFSGESSPYAKSLFTIVSVEFR